MLPRCATPLCLAVFRRVLRARNLSSRRLYAQCSGARRVRGSTRLVCYWRAVQTTISRCGRWEGRACSRQVVATSAQRPSCFLRPRTRGAAAACAAACLRAAHHRRAAALSTPAGAQAAFLPRQTAHRRTPTVVLRRRLRAAPRGLSVRLAGMPAAALWRGQALRLAHGHAPASNARGCASWRDRRWEHGACGNILDGGRKRRRSATPPLSTVYR